MRVDVHTHFYPSGYLKAIEQRSDHASITIDEQGQMLVNYAGDYNVVADAHRFVESRLADMDRFKVDMSVMSLTTPGVHVERPEYGIELSRLVNDEYADLKRQYPDRFQFFATLPLQAPEAAARELERAVRELGLVGAMVFSNVNGDTLEMEKFWPIYEAAQALDVPIMVHPTGPAFSSYLNDYRLVALLGFAYDTTLAAARMVLSGTLDRFPRLKLMQTHLGGVLPYMAERIERGYAIYPEIAGKLERTPMEYFRSMYLDTVLFDPDVTMLGLKFAGEDRVMLGSDHPHQVGDLRKAIAILDELPVDQSVKNKLFAQNAIKLLRLPIGKS
ncbi:MAG TPA: amidohydrolase family protein [Thermomicrobiaceae bacterium]|nr:amidohydrolase family protein [Thermomicrobiaceae bacterium]